MNKFLTELSFNKKLAAAALFLAVVAAVIGDPMKNNNSNINLNELASEVENQKDHIEAVELAEWVMQRKNDYTLIDIRDKNSFNEYHIPTAINSSLQRLVNEKYPPEKKIVIYSQGGTHGSQAWFFLKAMGYKQVYFLRHGLYEWIDEVLFPKIPKELYEKNQDEFSRISRKTQFFGGKVELSDSVTIAKKTYRREGC